MDKKRRSFMLQSNMLTRTAVKKAGGVKELAAMLGVTHQCIYAWGDKVPIKRVKQLEGLLSAKESAK